MLEITKSTTMTGTIKVNTGTEDESVYTQVVYLSAKLGSDDSTDTVSQTVKDKILYKANKAEIRDDIATFMQEFYDLQDSETTEEE